MWFCVLECLICFVAFCDAFLKPQVLISYSKQEMDSTDLQQSFTAELIALTQQKFQQPYFSGFSRN